MLTVSVPKLRVRDSRTAEVRPTRLKAWLDDLPQGDQEDSMQQILQALYVQNRTALEPINRLDLMELFRIPVFNIAESLAQIYTATPFPLTARQSNLANSVQRLFEELANGYKVVANDLITRGSTAKHKQEFVLTLQRATFTLSMIFLKCCEIYRPYPREAWRQIHQIYRLAETEDVLHYPVAKKASGHHMETVFSSYERGFLIGASDPYQLLQGECSQLFELIPSWRGHIRVSAWSDLENVKNPGVFLVNLASDSPPVHLAKAIEVGIDESKSSHYRLVSTLDVIKDVHSTMTALDSVPVSLPLTAGGGYGTNADFLRRFGRSLAGVGITRHATRTRYDRQAPMCFGMNSIHFFVNGQRTFQMSGQDSEVKHPVGLAANEEFFDLTDPDVGSALDPEQAGRRSRDLALYGNRHRLFTCGVKDQGAPGLCIKTMAPEGLFVRVGDLVGLQFPKPSQWSVGVVRWLQTHARSVIEFGVELLAPEFYPVAVKRMIDGDNFFQALMLPGSRSLRQPQSLLVPRGAYKAGEKLVLSREDGEQYKVSPIRVLDRTGSYDQLLVALPDIRNPRVS